MLEKWIVVILVCLMHVVRGGHEVLLPFSRTESFFAAPHEITIVQFDSRPLSSYWNTSVMWNAAYAKRFSHNFLFWSLSKPCNFKGIPLSASWCKLKAMVDADRADHGAKVMLFLDSDAIITAGYSMGAILSFVQDYLSWNMTTKPVAFNQDGPGYACSTSFRIGYPLCLNSGTVVWMKSRISSSILKSWWRMATKDISATKFPMDWRTKVLSVLIISLNCSR